MKTYCKLVIVIIVSFLISCGTTKQVTDYSDLVEEVVNTECKNSECAFTEAVQKASDDMGEFAGRLTSDSKTTDSLTFDILSNVRGNVEKGSELTYSDFVKFLKEHGRKLNLPDFIISLDDFDEGTIEHCLAKRVQYKLNSILGNARNNFVFEVKQNTADQQKSKEEFVNFLTDALMEELRLGINAFFEYRKIEIAGQKVNDACERISGVKSTGGSSSSSRTQTKSTAKSSLFYTTTCFSSSKWRKFEKCQRVCFEGQLIPMSRKKSLIGCCTKFTSRHILF